MRKKLRKKLLKMLLKKLLKKLRFRGTARRRRAALFLPQAAAADIRTMFNRCFSIVAAKEKKQKKIIF